MNESSLRYTTGRATASQIEAHLRACDQRFIPPLSDRVCIRDYAAKLAARGECFEAWRGAELVGLVAVYVERADPARAFISNVSVAGNEARRGVASRLLTTCRATLARGGVRDLGLEVSKENPRLIQWYEARGFEAARNVGTMLRMESGADGRAGKAVHPYASRQYAEAFAPREAILLPRARTHVLKRGIPGSAAFDTMACYPLFVFHEPPGEDLAELGRAGLVSFVGVTDALEAVDEIALRADFDHVREYKTHYLFDGRLAKQEYSAHHRARVRRARRRCETRVIDLSAYLDEWISCYETLVARQGVRGLRAFSRHYFEKVAEHPSAITIAAFEGQVMTSAHIWMRFRDRAYAHLAASTPRGYKLLSAFAIYDHAIRLFGSSHVIDFGGGAGTESDGDDGLSKFKRGFANDERANYLCGKILDARRYAQLSGDEASRGFFPAYRESA